MRLEIFALFDLLKVKRYYTMYTDQIFIILVSYSSFNKKEVISIIHMGWLVSLKGTIDHFVGLVGKQALFKDHLFYWADGGLADSFHN